MSKSADEREKRLAQLKQEATRRGFDRHASALRDVSELPVEFQTPAVLKLADCEPLQRFSASWSSHLRSSVAGTTFQKKLCYLHIPEESVFQPGTWKRWLHLFRRPLTPNTLLLLTSHYVVLIREDLNTGRGWILTYIPRQCIVDMKTQSCELCDEFIISLKRVEQTAPYKLSLTSGAVESWQARWIQIQHGGPWTESAN